MLFCLLHGMGLTPHLELPYGAVASSWLNGLQTCQPLSVAPEQAPFCSNCRQSRAQSIGQTVASVDLLWLSATYISRHLLASVGREPISLLLRASCCPGKTGSLGLDADSVYGTRGSIFLVYVAGWGEVLCPI